jgi:hypothetical protein
MTAGVVFTPAAVAAVGVREQWFVLLANAAVPVAIEALRVCPAQYDGEISWSPVPDHLISTHLRWGTDIMSDFMLSKPWYNLEWS